MARFLCFAAVLVASHAESKLEVPTQNLQAVPNATNGTNSTFGSNEEVSTRALRGFPGRWNGNGQGVWDGGFDGNSWGWGRGVPGETCCMCSRRNRRGRTVLFAAGDYDHFYGKRSAHQQCDRVCDLQCALRYGRKFGCFEENALRRMSRRYRGQTDFVIRHKKRFGNIC